jgi:hypothetical protein
VGIEAEVLEMFGDISLYPVVFSGRKNGFYCSDWMDKRNVDGEKERKQFCIII